MAGLRAGDHGATVARLAPRSSIGPNVGTSVPCCPIVRRFNQILYLIEIVVASQALVQHLWAGTLPDQSDMYE